MSSFPLTFIFFKMVIAPPTSNKHRIKVINGPFIVDLPIKDERW